MEIKKKDILYYARIIPKVGIYEVCEMTVSSVQETWFAVNSKQDKHRYLFSYSDIGKVIFNDRTEALNKVKESEKSKVKISDEIDYEEY